MVCFVFVGFYGLFVFGGGDCMVRFYVILSILFVGLFVCVFLWYLNINNV